MYTQRSLCSYFKKFDAMGAPKPIRRLITFIFIAAHIIIVSSKKSPIVHFELLKTKMSWVVTNDRLLLLENTRDTWI